MATAAAARLAAAAVTGVASSSCARGLFGLRALVQPVGLSKIFGTRAQRAHTMRSLDANETLLQMTPSDDAPMPNER